MPSLGWLGIPNICQDIMQGRMQCNIRGDTVKIIYKGKLVWLATEDPSTELWVLPLKPNVQPSQVVGPEELTQMAHNIFQLSSKESRIKFLHQFLFSPPNHLADHQGGYGEVPP